MKYKKNIRLLLYLEIIFTIIILLIIVIEGFSYIYIKNILYPEKSLTSIDLKSLFIDYINVEVKNDEGQKLLGWLLLNKKSNKTVLMLPGYGSNKSELINVASKIYNLGYSVLLIDLRAQGESEGDKCTLGVLEKNDVIYILTYIINDNRLKTNSIAIWADNISAFASIFALEKFPQVKLLLLNNIYSNPVYFLKEKINLPFKVPDYILDYLLYQNLKIFFEIDAKNYDLKDVLSKLKGKVLIFIGTEKKDYIVEKQLYDISPERKELILLKQAGTEALNSSQWADYYSLIEEKLKFYLPLNEVESIIHLEK